MKTVGVIPDQENPVDEGASLYFWRDLSKSKGVPFSVLDQFFMVPR